VERWRYEWTDEDGSPGHVRGVDVLSVRDGQISEKLSYIKGWLLRLLRLDPGRDMRTGRSAAARCGWRDGRGSLAGGPAGRRAGGRPGPQPAIEVGDQAGGDDQRVNQTV
jgi:hypothetical protein